MQMNVCTIKRKMNDEKVMIKLSVKTKYSQYAVLRLQDCSILGNIIRVVCWGSLGETSLSKKN